MPDKKEKMKKNILYILTASLLAGLFLFPGELAAQQKEVRVVKPYSPTLSGAEKIQLLPSLDEEITLDPPRFTYDLFTKLYASEYQVEPIRAARMVKPGLNRLYKSELTLGFGNYLTPLAELNINQLRSRNGTFGILLRHHSMNGKLKLDDEMKIPAGFNENAAKVYGSRFLKKAVLDYHVGAEYNSNIHYGVDTAQVTEDIPRDSLNNGYFLAEAGLGLHSMHADSFHFNYDAGLDYYYFTHQFNETEHGARVFFSFDKKLSVLDIAADVGGAFYGHYPDWNASVGNHTMVWLNPHVAKSSDDWRFTAGFNTYLSLASSPTAGDMQPFHFYPRASFQFNMVQEVIVPYFGVDGYLESNNYRSIVEENPYVLPTLSVKPTSHKVIGYAGVKGRISKAFSYKLKGSYSIIDDQYFFVNDTSQVLKNQFSVVAAEFNQLNLHGEFTFRPSDSWKVFLKGNYYYYTLSTMSTEDGVTRNLQNDDHAWNRPDWDASLQIRYNMQDKILINAGIYAIGKRYYEDFNTIYNADGTITPALLEESLPLAIDANLGVEYRYTKLLSFWLRLNNIAAQRYYLYNQYPSFRFRAMVGFTYAL